MKGNHGRQLSRNRNKDHPFCARLEFRSTKYIFKLELGSFIGDLVGLLHMETMNQIQLLDSLVLKERINLKSLQKKCFILAISAFSKNFRGQNVL